MMAARDLQSLLQPFRTGIIVASPSGVAVVHYAHLQGWTWYGLFASRIGRNGSCDIVINLARVTCSSIWT